MTHVRQHRAPVAWLVIFLVALSGLALGSGCGGAAASVTEQSPAAPASVQNSDARGMSVPHSAPARHCEMSGPCCVSSAGVADDAAGRTQAYVSGGPCLCISAPATAPDALVQASDAKTLHPFVLPIPLTAWSPLNPTIQPFLPCTIAEPPRDFAACPVSLRAPPTNFS